MNKKITTIAILGVFAFSGLAIMPVGVAQAQEGTLPDPGTLPGSPLYFIKSLFEGVGTLFTFGASAKAERYLALAEKRLAEAEALAISGSERAQAAIDRYQEQYEKALARAQALPSGDTDFNLLVRVTDAITKHLAVLDGVIERVPEQAKDAVRAAKERAIDGQINALRGIAELDQEAAIDIFARAADGRLQAAQANAERVGENGEDAKEALKEYSAYAEFGKEISSLAEGLRTGETTVEDLVRHATEQHMNVLRYIQTIVPVEAQDEMRRAMDNAVEIQQMAPAIQMQVRQEQSGLDGQNLPESEEDDVDVEGAGMPGALPQTQGVRQ